MSMLSPRTAGMHEKPSFDIKSLLIVDEHHNITLVYQGRRFDASDGDSDRGQISLL
jgi:hypothetical protein